MPRTPSSHPGPDHIHIGIRVRESRPLLCLRSHRPRYAVARVVPLGTGIGAVPTLHLVPETSTHYKIPSPSPRIFDRKNKSLKNEDDIGFFDAYRKEQEKKNPGK